MKTHDFTSKVSDIAPIQNVIFMPELVNIITVL